MTVKEIEPSALSSIFKEYLADTNTIFIFPTDVVMNSWIDWCITNPDESGTSAVPLERFMAWDKFKTGFASSSENGKTVIPSILKKIFIRNLIHRNKSEYIFKSIISPEFAGNASSFTEWMTSILPSLNLWHKKYQEYLSDEKINEEDDTDKENKDYLALYNEYSAFLNKNRMFDPAWSQPDFSATEKRFVIIYPEILQDFIEYRDILSRSDAITVIKLPEDDSFQADCFEYSDSRKELRRTVLKIRQLITEEKVAPSDIAVSVPSLSTYRPYIKREFENYCVPFVIRAGVPITKNCAGVIFSEINDCFRTDFSFDSMRALLLDEYIPWKPEIETLKENLLREGCRMRCVCSYSSEDGIRIDSWETALNSVATDDRELRFYKELKKDIKCICSSKSFKDIHTAWNIFKQRYLAENGFSPDADKIISRCITTLNEIIDIEKNYCTPELSEICNPFDFFINELNTKTYTKQDKSAGVNIYPYRLSAAANIKYQFVIDSSQNNLEIPFKQLSFLSQEKRKLFRLTDTDTQINPSAAFIRLYAKNPVEGTVQFSYAQQSFSGFAIAHNVLSVCNKEGSEPMPELDENDFILNEKNFFLSGGKTQPAEFSKRQKEQFLQWAKTKNNSEKDTSQGFSPEEKRKVRFVLIENREKADAEKSGKIILTQSDMQYFFPCPRKWYLKKVCRLEEDSLDTELFSAYDIGNIYHKILELFLNWRKDEFDSVLPCTQENNQFESEKEIRKKINELTDFVINDDFEMAFHESPLAKTSLSAQKNAITDKIMNTLHSMCLPKDKKGFGNFRIVCTEEWFNADDESEKWKYSGRMDCVLCDDNDEIYIIDFKAGKTPTTKESTVNKDGIINNFQIPMYITLWNENHRNTPAENAFFYSIKNAKPAKIVQSKANKSGKEVTITLEEYKNTLEVFREYAQAFYERIENENLEPSGNEDNSYNNVKSYTDCAVCNMKSICRTTYSIAKRELGNEDYND